MKTCQAREEENQKKEPDFDIGGIGGIGGIGMLEASESSKSVASIWIVVGREWGMRYNVLFRFVDLQLIG